MDEIINSLSPIERKILPYLKRSILEIVRESGLDLVTVTRALRFLENKGIVNLTQSSFYEVDLGINGIYYKKNALPERKLLNIIMEKRVLSFEEAQSLSKLTDNEFKVSLGILKNKNLVELKNGKILLLGNKEKAVEKFPEEKLIELLPINKKELEKYNNELESLKKRKDIVKIVEKKELAFTLTELGTELLGKKIKTDLLEEVTPQIIKEGVKGKVFRKYDIFAPVPKINGGKRHFVNQAVEYIKDTWTSMGFKEMEGDLIDTSFWVFDSLFTPQDHPAREMQDSFYLKMNKDIEKQVANKVKEAHEKGVDSSKGWQSVWSENEAKKLLLRTQTTTLSARTLLELKEADLPAKFFAVGKVFRNETIDWSHGIEFYQTEGIVVDPNANFRQLLGWIKTFYEKIGFQKIKFRPSYFAYTEPSVEIVVYHEGRKQWLELGGAGIFRPEVTIPLLGKKIPVLAWGQGFDRIIMDLYKINDLRKLYSNDIKELRESKFLIK